MKRMLKREQIPSVPEYKCAGHVRVCLCVSLTVMIQRGCSLYSTFIRLINENSLKPHIDLHLLLLVLRQPPLSLVSAFILHLFLLTFSQFTYNSHSLAQYCKGQSNYTGMKTKPSEVPYHSWYDHPHPALNKCTFTYRLCKYSHINTFSTHTLQND